MHPDADQAALMIERGAAAKRLLEDTTFCSVVDDLTNYNLSALCASKPGDAGREAREYHHLLQYALTEICRELQTRQAAGEQMQDALDNHEDTY